METLKPMPASDQMLRGAIQVQLSLTQMADMKANIIITVTSILMTVSLPFIQQPSLQVPILMLDLFGLGAVICAVLAVRPRISRGRNQVPEMDSPAFNIFFFGHFSDMDSRVYEDEILAICSREGEPYRRIARNVHAMGAVLAQKYRFIRMAYTLFALGIVLSFLTYFVVFAIG